MSSSLVAKIADTKRKKWILGIGLAVVSGLVILGLRWPWFGRSKPSAA